jgi:hypothetical protein
LKGTDVQHRSLFLKGYPYKSGFIDCCLSSDSVKETVRAKEYLGAFFQTTPQTLNIKVDIVHVMKTGCRLPGFGQYLRLKDRQLPIQIKGVFFYLEPAVND